MIKHIVFLQFKSTFSEVEIAEAINQFGHLKQFIPLMKSFSGGRNCSPEGLSKGFTHAFVMEFATIESRDAYLDHPEHKRIAQEIVMPMLVNGLDSAIVIDYQTDSAFTDTIVEVLN
ncbi:Stress responsive A/B barrel domain protein [Legionella beliardensis]|uniref:Stress responsive A/B barrel domain protein n=1 Tax=Legionella beliardensis TaxID=91822 RepID=A0A378I1V9_9GAMM|nr:Dabb family protein [Legionella beliardensis]STX28983.1 Stress responsive A/B barrel domain protein [Legionella beliardensis]